MFSNVFFMVSEFRGPEDAFEPFGGPKVSKSNSFFIESYRKLPLPELADLLATIISVPSISSIRSIHEASSSTAL